MSIAGATSERGDRFDNDPHRYDAVLLISYGGPEGLDDVLPFLENATRDRGVPRERLLAVAGHYQHFGGVSPINAQNRALATALAAELARIGLPLPVYLGNRNWHPMLETTVAEMRDAGVRRAIAVVTSAFSSYSGCRQYRADVVRALAAAGAGAPVVDKIRVFYNHPLFVAANAASLRTTLDAIPSDGRDATRVIFTAHSIPVAMARQCAYETQLHEAARLIAATALVPSWNVVYQSRSGSRQVPWLEPDILDSLREAAAAGVEDVVVLPLGFVSDHMEVRYDLDVEAQAVAGELGIRLLRVKTVGTAPPFISMLRELIQERIAANPTRRALGPFGPSHDICPIDCCLGG